MVLGWHFHLKLTEILKGDLLSVYVMTEQTGYLNQKHYYR